MCGRYQISLDAHKPLFLAFCNRRQEVCHSFTASEKLSRIFAHPNIAQHRCNDNCHYKHSIQEDDCLTLDKIKQMAYAFDKGVMDRGKFAIGRQSWNDYRMGIVSPGQIVSSKIAPSCDFLHGRAAVDKCPGCHIRGCIMWTRPNESGGEHFNWDT